MKNNQKIFSFLGALFVKLVTYFAISVIFVLLFYWSGMIEKFNWRYAVVLAVGLLFLRIFLSEIIVKTDKK